MLTKTGIATLIAGSSLGGAGISTGATILIKNKQISELSRDVDFINEERSERARMREENQKCRKAMRDYNQFQNDNRYFNRYRSEYGKGFELSLNTWCDAEYDPISGLYKNIRIRHKNIG